MEDLVTFCFEHNLVLIASEVLQSCIHNSEASFISFRKIVLEMPSPYNELELFSYHSGSKANGFNSSSRIGFLHCLNIDKEVMLQLYKLISIDICASSPGQIMLDLALSTFDEEIYGSGFVKRYNESIRLCKEKYSNMINEFNEALTNQDLFTLKKPEAGFTFFLELKKNENVVTSRLVNIYIKQLLKETGVACKNGLGKYFKF